MDQVSPSKTPPCRELSQRKPKQKQKAAQTKKTAALIKQLAEPNKKYANAYVKIVEQPASTGVRFRYECEGRAAGSILGVNSTLECRTYPSIKVVGYKGRSVCVVSCVTKDPPYRPHPHYLVGREGCKNGVYTFGVKEETMSAELSNLGIQCVKKTDIEASLKAREEIRVDPFKTGFAHALQPASININAVRLCFQVFIQGQTGHYTVPLKPVVSDPIYDKKAKLDLIICQMCNSTTVLGNAHIMILCEKVTKEDIAVRFFEEKHGVVVWEAYGDFQSSDVHRQTSIRLKTPKYHNTDITEPVKVFVQLERPSDGAVSEPWEFKYEPINSDEVLLKRKCSRIGLTMASVATEKKQTNSECIDSIMRSWNASNKSTQNTITKNETSTPLDLLSFSSEMTSSSESLSPLTATNKSDSSPPQNTITKNESSTPLDLLSFSSEKTSSPEPLSPLTTTNKSDSSPPYGKVTEVLKLKSDVVDVDKTPKVKATDTPMEDNVERKVYPDDQQPQDQEQQQHAHLDQLLQQPNCAEIQQQEPNQLLQELNLSQSVQQSPKVQQFPQEQQQSPQSLHHIQQHSQQPTQQQVSQQPHLPQQQQHSQQMLMPPQHVSQQPQQLQQQQQQQSQQMLMQPQYVPQQPQQLQQQQHIFQQQLQPQQPLHDQPQQVSIQENQFLQPLSLLQLSYLQQQQQQQQQMTMQQQQPLLPQQQSQQLLMPPQQVSYQPYLPQQSLQPQQLNPQLFSYQPQLNQQLPYLMQHMQQPLPGNGETMNWEEKFASFLAFAAIAFSSNPFNLQHFLSITANNMRQNVQSNFPLINLQQQQPQPPPPPPPFQQQQPYLPPQQYQTPPQQENVSNTQFQQQINATTSSNDDTLVGDVNTKNNSGYESDMENSIISHLLNLESDELVPINCDDTLLDEAINNDLELSSLTISL